MTSLRLLILAELNHPEWVSVPRVGFEHSFALAKDHRVTLVTHAQNTQAIEAKTQRFVRVVGIDLGWLDRVYAWCFRVLFKGDFGSQALTAFRYPFYLYFEFKAWRALKKEIEAGAFDAVLRLTPVSPVLPSPIAVWCRKRKLPFVLGPINGGLPWPLAYQQAQKQKEWISGLRRLHEHFPYAAQTYDAAAAIIVGSSQTYQSYQALHEKLFFIPENGMRSEQIASAPRALHEGPLRLIFVGRLVPFKACDLALRAAAPLLKAGRAQFTILGDGPERTALEAWVAEQGLQDRVRFTGTVAFADVLEQLKVSDALVFPSIREFGGGVVFEAMALGVVPLVSDYGGPGDTVDASFGFKIPLSDESGSCSALSLALQKLDEDRHLLASLSRQAIAHCREHLSWEGKAQKTTAVLRWVLGQGPYPAELKPAQTRPSAQ